MPGYSYLSGQDHSFSQASAPGNADLGYNNRPFAHLDIVSNLNQVVDFGALADMSLAQGCPIDSRIGPNLHIVFNDYPSNLRDFVHCVSSGSKAKAVTAYYDSGVQNNPVPKTASGHQGAV
jgi:hypothetical protein